MEASLTMTAAFPWLPHSLAALIVFPFCLATWPQGEDQVHRHGILQNEGALQESVIHGLWVPGGHGLFLALPIGAKGSSSHFHFLSLVAVSWGVPLAPWL